MRLYCLAPGVELWHGDCRQASSVLGQHRFSLALADPPYEQTALAWDVWPHGWLEEMRRLLGPEGSLWCWGTLRSFIRRATEFEAAGFRLAQDVVWEKHNGSQPATGRFLRVHEQVAHFYPEDVPWGRVYKDPQRMPAPREHRHKAGRVVKRGASPAHTGKHKPCTYVDDGTRRQRSVWQVRSEHHRGRSTATPKPVAVLEPLVRYSCPPGGSVLVPFVGGGAEIEACRRIGRTVVGFDTDESALALTVRRLSQGTLI